MLTHTTTRLLAQLASVRAGFPGGVLSQRHATVSGFSMPPTAVRWLHDNIPSTPPASDKPGGGRSESPIEKYIAPGRPPKVVRSTFDPQKLIASDFVDISGRLRHYVYFADGGVASLGMNYLQRGSKYYGFPKGSHGFFYYWTPPAPFPDIAGELRFRVTASEDPASFEAGHDLRAHRGSIWRVPLCSLVHVEFGVHIQAQLLKDGLVQRDTLEGWSSSPTYCRVHNNHKLLYSLSQHLQLDLSTDMATCTTVSKRDIGRIRLPSLFQYRAKGKLVSPFKGLITACFERSTLPEHTGTCTLFLRIVKVPESAQPVDPDYNGPIPFPVVGKLLMNVGKDRKTAKTSASPRAFIVDDKSLTGKSLALLWGTEGWGVGAE